MASIADDILDELYAEGVQDVEVIADSSADIWDEYEEDGTYYFEVRH